MWSLHVIFKTSSLGIPCEVVMHGVSFRDGDGVNILYPWDLLDNWTKSSRYVYYSKLILNSNQDINCNVGASL